MLVSSPTPPVRDLKIVGFGRGGTSHLARLSSHRQASTRLSGGIPACLGKSFARDYSGLKRGDRTLNQQMFQPNGRLQQAIPQTIQLMQEDRQRGRIVREAVDINAEPMLAALKEWQP